MQLRDVLDCYVDGELSAEAMAAADVHLRECASCAQAVDHLQTLRRELRRVVGAHMPPPDLAQRIRRSLRLGWSGDFAKSGSLSRLGAAAAVLIAIGLSVGLLSVGLLNLSGLRDAAADVLDRAAVKLGTSTPLELDATVLCRDCELHSRYGEQTFCDRIGHHGVIATADGQMWNIVEQGTSADLIHNNALLGRKVHVRGRLFRDAGAIAVEAYEFTDVRLSRSSGDEP